MLDAMTTPAELWENISHSYATHTKYTTHMQYGAWPIKKCIYGAKYQGTITPPSPTSIAY